MQYKKNNLLEYSDKDVLNMIDDTSRIIGKLKVDNLSSTAIAAQNVNSLTSDVEFWNWMSRNYKSSGIFNDANSMQQYIQQGAGKEAWMYKQIQGKGYEWDWMTKQQENFKNLFKRYDAGDIASRAGSDVTEINVFTGESQEYQMKAYTGKKNPNLKNTPKDTTVVTNAEKVGSVKSKGYNDVDSFQDKNSIKEATDKRMDKIKNGKVETVYTFKNVSVTMAKAGIIGCAIGMGIETLVSYKSWKNNILSDEEYLNEILKSGGDAGLTAGATAGVMIPISAAITAAGLSTIVTIPIAFAVGSVINKVIAPCFGRGQYKEILAKAKYYQNLQGLYTGLIENMEIASNQYYDFIMQMQRQKFIHDNIKEKSKVVDKDLKELYDSI